MKVLLLVLAGIALASAVGIQRGRSKRHSCKVNAIKGIFYPKGNLLGEMNMKFAENLDDCVEMCLERPECHYINFLANDEACMMMNEGYKSPSEVNKKIVYELPDATHAYIDCGPGGNPTPKPASKPNGPVGCGRQGAGYDPTVSFTRIINGQEAKQHSWPWLVTLQVQSAPNALSMCGSNLIRVSDKVEASDILVTAAHCVTRPETMGSKPVSYQPAVFTAIAGNHRQDKREPDEQVRQASAVRFHDKFRFTERTGANNDIAIIKLDKPIEFTDTIRPICLPAAGEALPVNQQCMAAGWGRVDMYDERVVAKVLQQAKTPAHPKDICTRGWGLTYVEDQMICAGDLTGKTGSCQGDSGGMLACRKDDKSPWVLYGATSFGMGGTCVAPYRPGIYSRVSNYIPWIQESIRQMSSIKA